MLSPSAERNIQPITEKLTGLLSGRNGRLLEIGAGTGLHAAYLAKALPQITWIPSDPAEVHRRSIDAWRAHLSPPNLKPAIALDALTDWPKMPEIAETPLTAIFSANVIHIAPWEVTLGIIAGARHALEASGLLIFYGPFKEAGAHTGEGNIRFDASLRARDPSWGIRDIDALREEASGFSGPELHQMPSNNRLLVLRRSP
ncbi:MAG: DUF938 domain-containing protein [Pseudomonadota bacterium]